MMSLEFRKGTEKLASTPVTGASREAVADVESELEVIFGASGRQALLVELSKRYGVVPSDAIGRPDAFHTALYYLLGELSSKFVMDRINMRVRGSVPVSLRVS
ncbi:MAG: hypothetical protein ABSB56_04295 [Nitrososphaerales archaeon]|jgi:hypothetical protein